MIKTTPDMWKMVSNVLDKCQLPVNINTTIHGLCEGTLMVVKVPVTKECEELFDEVFYRLQCIMGDDSIELTVESLFEKYLGKLLVKGDYDPPLIVEFAVVEDRLCFMANKLIAGLLEELSYTFRDMRYDS